eukprot:5132026-Prymnesium_polylepis.2
MATVATQAHRLAWAVVPVTFPARLDIGDRAAPSVLKPNTAELGEGGQCGIRRSRGGQTRQHGAGWWGGAGLTVGDRHSRLWCAWG